MKYPRKTFQTIKETIKSSIYSTNVEESVLEGLSTSATEQILHQVGTDADIKMDNIRETLHNCGIDPIGGVLDKLELVLLRAITSKEIKLSLPSTIEDNNNKIETEKLEELSETRLNEITNDIGLKSFAWIMKSTPIIAAHFTERKELESLYSTYHENMEALHEIIKISDKILRMETSDNEQPSLSKLKDATLQNKAANTVISTMILTIKKIKQINQDRLSESKRKLMFLPNLGRNEMKQFPLSQFPRTYTTLGQFDVFYAWQVVSKFAEMHNLTKKATLQLFSLISPTQVSLEIESHLSRIAIDPMRPLEDIILDLEQKFKIFPSVEDWRQAHQNFTRKHGETLKSCYIRLKLICSRRFYRANKTDSNIIFIETTLKKLESPLNPIIEEDTRIFLLMKATELKLSKTMNDLNTRFALAKFYEDLSRIPATRQLCRSLNPRILNIQKLPAPIWQETFKDLMNDWNSELTPKAIKVYKSDCPPYSLKKGSLECTNWFENSLPQTIIPEIYYENMILRYKYTDSDSFITSNEVRTLANYKSRLNSTFKKAEWKTLTISHIPNQLKIRRGKKTINLPFKRTINQ